MGAIQEQDPTKPNKATIINLDAVRAERTIEAARAAMQPTVDEIIAVAQRWNDEIEGGLFAHDGQRIRAFPPVVDRQIIPGVSLPDPTPEYPQTWLDLQNHLEKKLADRAPVGSPGYNNLLIREGVLQNLGLPRKQIPPDLALGVDEESNWYLIESGVYQHVFLVTHVKHVENGVELSEKMILSKSREELVESLTTHFVSPVMTFPDESSTN